MLQLKKPAHHNYLVHALQPEKFVCQKEDPAETNLKKKKSKWSEKPESTGTLWTVKKESVLLVNVGRRTRMKLLSPSCLYATRKGRGRWRKDVCGSLSQGGCGERNVLLFPACFCESKRTLSRELNNHLKNFF